MVQLWSRAAAVLENAPCRQLANADSADSGDWGEAGCRATCAGHGKWQGAMRCRPRATCAHPHAAPAVVHQTPGVSMRALSTDVACRRAKPLLLCALLPGRNPDMCFILTMFIF